MSSLTKSRVRVPAVLFVALIALFATNAIAPAVFSVVSPTSAATTPAPPPAFKWSMPKRFGPKNADGIVDYHWKPATRTYEDSYVRPATWRVEFDACVIGAPANSTYQWEVDGVVVSQPNTTSCTFAHEFAAQRTYAVKLTITMQDGTQTVVETPVAIKDLLIVSIGDSFASGQGNPDLIKKGSTPAKWVDKVCARSALAGPAQAALSIEEADPHTSITFISFACSGAEINAGLLQRQMKGSIAVGPQIEKLREAVNGRTIDALLLSVGGNDLGFSDLVAQCILRADCFKKQETLNLFNNGLAQLPGRYQALNDEIVRLQPTTKVFITEYPELLRDENAELCNRQPRIAAVFSISRDEARWASEVVVPALNSQVKAAADQHGWVYVGGVADKFRTHGYCAKKEVRWVRTFEDAREVQGADKDCDDVVSFLKLSSLKQCLISSGSVHPSGGGHATYATRLVEELQRARVTIRPVL